MAVTVPLDQSTSYEARVRRTYTVNGVVMYSPWSNIQTFTSLVSTNTEINLSTLNESSAVNDFVFEVGINAPVITLNGGNEVDHVLGMPWVELGFTASDIEDGDLSASVVITGTINENENSYQTLTYSVTDSDGNTTQIERIVAVAPILAPTSFDVRYKTQSDPDFTIVTGVIDSDLSLTGLATDETYSWGVRGDNSGAKSDWVNGQDFLVSSTLPVTINLSTLLETSEVFSFVFEAGVNIPVLTLIGGNNVTHSLGTPWVELGFTAIDAEDGDISASVVITGTIDENENSYQLLNYSVTDSDGNTAEQERRVAVTEFLNAATFDVGYKEQGETSYTVIESLTDSDYALTGLTNNETYNWRVRSVNGNVRSDWVNGQDFLAFEDPPIEINFNTVIEKSSVNEFTVEIEDGPITVLFTTVQESCQVDEFVFSVVDPDNVVTPTEFEVEINNLTAGTSQLIAASSTSLALAGLDPYQLYRIRVRGVFTLYFSAWTEFLTFYTRPVVSGYGESDYFTAPIASETVSIDVSDFDFDPNGEDLSGPVNSNVAGVDVEILGLTYPAEINNNAWYLENPFEGFMQMFQDDSLDQQIIFKVTDDNLTETQVYGFRR